MDRVLARTRRGFLLAAALAVTFAMVVLALVVATQTRAMVTFARNTRAEALQTEGAHYLGSALRGVLPPANASLPNRFGLPEPLPPAPNGATQAFAGDCLDGETHVAGNLTYFTNGTQAREDGYVGQLPAAGATALKVPYLHACAVFNTNVTREPGSNRYVYMYSVNHPLALIAAGGPLNVRSVRSVASYNGINISALMAHVYGQGVTINGPCNGHAWSQGRVQLAGPGGLPHPNWTNPITLPADFVEQLGAFRAQAVATAGTNLMGSVATGGRASFGGGTLSLASGLHLPKASNERLDYNQVTVAGDLWLEEGSVLYVSGNLVVMGTIRLSPQASLVVAGDTSCGALSVVSGASTTLGMYRVASTLSSGGSLTITDGMNRDSNVTYSGFTPYEGNIFATGPPDTSLVPGLLITAGGTLTVTGGERVSGLLVGRDITVGATMLVGAAWASGSLTAQDVRYFPYYTHFFARTPTGSLLTVAAFRPHAIAYGRLP
jgi:hypothetical protein